MDWFRSAIGISSTPSSGSSGSTSSIVNQRRAAASERPLHERLHSLEKTHRLQYDSLQEEYEEVKAVELQADRDMKESAAIGDRGSAANHMAKRNSHRIELAKIQDEMVTTNGKLQNVRAQIAAMQTANANVDQAISIQDTAAVLKETTEAVEAIDLQGAVDDIQDSAKTMQEHDKLLTTPIFATGKVKTTVARTEAEAELDRLMRQHDPILPSVPPRSTGPFGGGGGVEPVVGPIQKGPVEEK